MALQLADQLSHKMLEKKTSSSQARGENAYDSHVIHFNKLNQVELHARHRATYSTVKRATRLVSSPNQIRVGIEWKAGTVSKTVTSADKRMRKVVNM